MKSLKREVLGLLFAVAASVLPASAQDFKVYPGGKIDADAGRQASSKKSQSEVYVTSDSFDRVYAFYKGLYKEHPWKVPAPTLPSGKPVRWAFFILDGAKDLKESKFWLKIQYPYIRTVDEKADYKDIRDITTIQTVHH